MVRNGNGTKWLWYEIAMVRNGYGTKMIFTMVRNVSPRQKKLEAFLQECGYLHKATGHTFTHPNVHDCSTIDYIFLHQQFDKEMTEVIKLDLLPENTSDHYPLITQLVASLDIKETMKEKPGFTGQTGKK